MKKSVIAVLALSMMLMASMASANVIGIFGDEAGTLCSGNMNIPYTYVNIKFIAVLSDVASITAAEFGATNVNLLNTIPTVTWTTTLVIGNIMTPDGVALAWTTPQPGPIVQMGNIQYFLLAAQPADVKLQILPSGAGVLAIVDEVFIQHNVTGWGFVVNCTVGGQYGACTCLDNIPTQDSSWGAVKSLF